MFKKLLASLKVFSQKTLKKFAQTNNIADLTDFQIGVLGEAKAIELLKKKGLKFYSSVIGLK